MGYGPNVFPTTMASNSEGGFVLTTSPAFSSAPYKLFDGDDATYCYIQGSLPHVITIQLPVAKTLTKISYLTYLDAGYVIKDGTIEGSNDGSSWDLLLTITGAPNTASTQTDWTFANTTAYLYYRITQTAGYAANELALRNMLGYEDAVVTETTWTGDASDGDVTNAANWDNGLPDATIDAIIGGSDTALACLSSPYVLTCKGLDMSAFTGSVGDDDGDVFEVSPHGAVVLTSAITVNPNGGFDIDEGGSYTLTTGGLELGYLRVGAGETVTLADDLVVTGAGGSPLAFDSGSTLAMGTHDITIRPYTGDFPMNTTMWDASAVTWSGGATITLDFAHTNTGSTYALNGNVAITLPPFYIKTSGGATGEVQIGSFKAQSLTITGPNITANHYSLETIGDYTLDQATVLPVTTGQVMTIGGAGAATASTITGMDFSGGSTLYAPGCTDGTGNTNVDFTAVTTWDTDSGDGDGANAANWSEGLPDETVRAVIIGSGANIINDSGDFTITCKSLDMSGFDGSVGLILPDDGGTKIFDAHVYGDVTLGAGMTMVVPMDLYVDGGTCVLEQNGKTINALEVYGELTLTDDLTYTGYVYTEGTVNQGAFDFIYDTTAFLATLLASGFFSAGGFFVGDGTVYNWSAGAVIGIVTGATIPGPTEVDSPTGILLPTIAAIGDGALKLGGAGIHAYSFLANDCDITTTSAVNIENSAVAHDCMITNADFSGGTALDATDGCTDGTGNTNVNFTEPIAPDNDGAGFFFARA